MRLHLHCIVFALCLFFTGQVASAKTLRGMVKTVYDGDTLVMVGRGTGRVTVRLYGIDAPETAKHNKPGQPFGSQSRRVLMYKLLGKEVIAVLVDHDQHGRAVAVVKQAGRDINAEMVEEGMAWAYRQFLMGPDASRYINLEEKARRLRRGLWRDRTPQPPWEFRRKL